MTTDSAILRDSAASGGSHGFSLSSSLASSVYSSMEVPRTEYDQLSASSNSSSSSSSCDGSTDEASPASRGMQIRRSVISLRVPAQRPVRSASLGPLRSLQDHSHRRSRSMVEEFTVVNPEVPETEVSLELTPTATTESIEETEVTPEPPQASGEDDDVLLGYLQARTESKRVSSTVGKPPLSRSSSSPTLATAIRNVRRSMASVSDSLEKETTISPDKSPERGSLNSMCGFGSPVRHFSIDKVTEETTMEVPVVEHLQSVVICAEDLEPCEVPLENGLVVRVGYPERGWVSVFTATTAEAAVKIRPSGVGLQCEGKDYRLSELDENSQLWLLYQTAREVVDRLRETTCRIRGSDQESFIMADDISVTSRTFGIVFHAQQRPWKGNVSVKEVRVVAEESRWKLLCNGLDLPAVTVPVSVIDERSRGVMEALLKRDLAASSTVDVTSVVTLMISVWPTVVARRSELIDRDFDMMARAHSEYLEKMRASAVPKDIVDKLGGVSSSSSSTAVVVAASGG